MAKVICYKSFILLFGLWPGFLPWPELHRARINACVKAASHRPDNDVLYGLLGALPQLKTPHMDYIHNTNLLLSFGECAYEALLISYCCGKNCYSFIRWQQYKFDISSFCSSEVWMSSAGSFAWSLTRSKSAGWDSYLEALGKNLLQSYSDCLAESNCLQL